MESYGEFVFEEDGGFCNYYEFSLECIMTIKSYYLSHY